LAKLKFLFLDKNLRKSAKIKSNKRVGTVPSGVIAVLEGVYDLGS